MLSLSITPSLTNKTEFLMVDIHLQRLSVNFWTNSANYRTTRRQLTRVSRRTTKRYRNFIRGWCARQRRWPCMPCQRANNYWLVCVWMWIRPLLFCPMYCWSLKPYTIAPSSCIPITICMDCLEVSHTYGRIWVRRSATLVSNVFEECTDISCPGTESLKLTASTLRRSFFSRTIIFFFLIFCGVSSMFNLIYIVFKFPLQFLMHLVII